MRKSETNSFIVARRISRRMLRLYLIVYLLTLLAIALVSIPVVCRASYKNCVNTLTDITANLEEMQQQMTSAASNLIYSDVVASKLFSQSYASDQNKTSVIELDLDSFMDRNPNVLGLRLRTGEGASYYPIFSYKYDLPSLLEGDPGYNAILEKDNSSYYGPLVSDVFNATGMQYDAFSYSVTHTRGANKFTATIFFNANSCLKINRRLISRTMDGCVFVDRSNNIVYSTDESMADTLTETPLLYTAHISGSSFTAQGVWFYSMATSSGWHIVCFASYFTLAKYALIILALIMVLSLIAPLSYNHFIKRSISDELKPVKELSSIMHDFKIGQEIRTNIHTGDEIQDMCISFNEMVSTINHQALEIREQEKQNAMVLYKLLVTQIDPHFIYNTMNVINIMARSGETDAIVEVNSALIKILRERLSVKLSALHTLAEEIDTLEQYNLIMHYRFSDHVNTYISVAPELLSATVPKNLLQPLLENALYHGCDFQNPDRSLDVDIMAYSQGADMIIEISDNGKGMTPERLKLIQENSTDLYKDEKPHIGIDNIRQRLSFLYGDRARLEISSELNAGTNIVITLPLEPDEPPHD